MKKGILGVFIRIQFKRSVRVWCKALLGFILPVIAVILLLVVLAVGFRDSLEFEPVKVGVVIRDDDRELQTAMSLISALDSVSYVCSMENIGYDEGMDKLEKGDIGALLVIPEGFYNDINTGINTPFRLIVSDDSPFMTEVFTELIYSAVEMIDIAESGIYAVTDVSLSEELRMKRSEMEMLLTQMFAKEIFDRNGKFSVYLSSTMGGLSLKEYYSCVLMCIILLISALGFKGLYTDSDLRMDEVLKSRGVNAFFLWAARVVIIFVFLLIEALLLSYICARMIKTGPMDILFLIPVSFCIACMSDLLFGTTHSGKDQGLLYIMVCLLLLMLGGFFVPVDYFARDLADISGVLPFTAMRDCLGGLFTIPDDYSAVMWLIFYSVVSAILSIFIRWKNT